MSKKRPPLDIKTLKEMKSKGGLRFMKFKEPVDNTFFAYRILCLDEPYETFNKRFNRTETHLQIKLESALNDEDVVVGQSYRINLNHAVLRRNLEDARPLKGKVFDIMIRGRVRGKNSTYVDYAVMPQVGELNLENLLTEFFTE